ncbi:hypothetical protein BX600DRAFT_197508 [Xylariales sp. PMI_506]|nr:hypothetical protein BX600DRAFT_197508 [Xylariales sp. PMI_506]
MIVESEHTKYQCNVMRTEWMAGSSYLPEHHDTTSEGRRRRRTRGRKGGRILLLSFAQSLLEEAVLSPVLLGPVGMALGKVAVYFTFGFSFSNDMHNLG